MSKYTLNNIGSIARARPIESLAQRLERWMHYRVASLTGGPILELGAGTLNHLAYEDSTTEYDIVEPFRELFAASPRLSRVRTIYENLASIPADQTYHRIISIAVLEHMTNLPSDLAMAALRLRDGGILQAGIPSEGGLLWWLGWRFSTGISYYLRTRLDYGVVMRHEHVNQAPEILAVLRYLFRDVRLKRFPLFGHHLSFYTYIEARHPVPERCRVTAGEIS